MTMPDEFETYDTAQLNRIEKKLDSLIEAHTAMVDKVNNIVSNVEPHIKDVAPMIDAIANNPMFKMFAGGKKK